MHAHVCHSAWMDKNPDARELPNWPQALHPRC